MLLCNSNKIIDLILITCFGGILIDPCQLHVKRLIHLCVNSDINHFKWVFKSINDKGIYTKGGSWLIVELIKRKMCNSYNQRKIKFNSIFTSKNVRTYSFIIEVFMLQTDTHYAILQVLMLISDRPVTGEYVETKKEETVGMDQCWLSKSCHLSVNVKSQ